MPELPEVETIKNELVPHVVGRRISGITLFWDGMVKEISAAEFCARLKGQRIGGLRRRGKYLIFSLSGGGLLIVHLKMSGSLLLGRDSSEPPQYTRAIIHLDNGLNIFFRDPRKFGRMRLAGDGDRVISRLGPEPLEEGFTATVLAERLSRRKAPIKAALIDQTVIAGIGNMYADEALFAAGIHPLRPACSLSKEELKRLHRAIKQVLLEAINDKGASVSSYFRPGGEKGSAQFQFRVAHRRGQDCLVCGTPLERLVIRNRGSYFCPKCQS